MTAGNTDYNHKETEKNWTEKWYETDLYKAKDFSDKPKKYILAELPYPSGSYLHVGHMMRYTVPEIRSRYLRMQGYNVLFPMGWDSFGLPAETFAIRTNSTPREVLDKAIPNYKKSMMDMGYAIDWSREMDTSKPETYKWTQWMFLKLWEADLAEVKEMPVWWCEELGVLADEEVLPGDKEGEKVSERGGYPVERKMFKQWILKITDYADKLLEDLDKTDYTDAVKQAQINWIGKKEGANITYEIETPSKTYEKTPTVTCFTTRPDTNFGATFVVLAPKHPLVEKVTTAEQKSEVEKYVKRSLAKSELERTKAKEKTGVFTGSYAINPLNDKKLPVYVADYVMYNYGTGAVVGVPAHDKRDFEFAKAHDLEVVRVVEDPENPDVTEIASLDDIFEGEGIAINSGFLNGLTTKEAIEKTIQYLEEKGFGEKNTTYKLRDQIWSRQRYWGEPIPLIYTKDGKIEPDYDLPLELPELKEEVLKDKAGFPALSEFEDFKKTTDSQGNPATRETDTMPTWAGSNWYYIRYIDPKNNEAFADFEKMKYWLPVDEYYGDAGHTTAHLLYTRFWYKFLYDQGLVPTEEPIKYRMSGGLLLGEDNRKMSKSRPEYVVNPKEVVQTYGADAVRTYLAFIGPYDETYPWNTEGLKAISRFINTVYGMKNKVVADVNDKEVEKAYHQMLKNVTSMCEDFKMNTAVSQLMIFVNIIKKKKQIDSEIWKGFLKVLAPFAPFVTEELWQEVNDAKEWSVENSIHSQAWPKYNEKLAKKDSFQIGVQVNGKVREDIEIDRDEPEESVKKRVLELENVQKYVKGKNIKRFIYVPNKIVSIVVE
ncbi:leucine--tRNA ligase [candidate division WWE3 bacterium]|nr:leucine--tRNA ligase [candidate division WWE3 bacterium]